MVFVISVTCSACPAYLSKFANLFCMVVSSFSKVVTLLGVPVDKTLLISATKVAAAVISILAIELSLAFKGSNVPVLRASNSERICVILFLSFVIICWFVLLNGGISYKLFLFRVLSRSLIFSFALSLASRALSNSCNLARLSSIAFAFFAFDLPDNHLMADFTNL